MDSRRPTRNPAATCTVSRKEVGCLGIVDSSEVGLPSWARFRSSHTLYPSFDRKAMMFYRLNIYRVTLREFFAASSIRTLLLLPFFLLMKLLRIRSRNSVVVPGRFEPFLVERESLPEDVKAKIAPARRGNARLRFSGAGLLLDHQSLHDGSVLHRGLSSSIGHDHRRHFASTGPCITTIGGTPPSFVCHYVSRWNVLCVHGHTARILVGAGMHC